MVTQRGLLTTRGIFTVQGRQFALNGYLARNAAGAMRLVVTENFGGVMADLLVEPDGAVRLMRSGAVLRPVWIRRYVAGDLACLFGRPAPGSCAVQQLDPDHYRIERRWYTLDLRTVASRPGPQPPELFDAKKAVGP